MWGRVISHGYHTCHAGCLCRSQCSPRSGLHWCGWHVVAPVDLEHDAALEQAPVRHSIYSQLNNVCFISCLLSCAAKFRAREKPRALDQGDHLTIPMGDQERVDHDNLPSDFGFALQAWGNLCDRACMRENPAPQITIALPSLQLAIANASDTQTYSAPARAASWCWRARRGAGGAQNVAIWCACSWYTRMQQVRLAARRAAATADPKKVADHSHDFADT